MYSRTCIEQLAPVAITCCYKVSLFLLFLGQFSLVVLWSVMYAHGKVNDPPLLLLPSLHMPFLVQSANVLLCLFRTNSLVLHLNIHVTRYTPNRNSCGESLFITLLSFTHELRSSIIIQKQLPARLFKQRLTYYTTSAINFFITNLDSKCKIQ